LQWQGTGWSALKVNEAKTRAERPPQFSLAAADGDSLTEGLAVTLAGMDRQANC